MSRVKYSLYTFKHKIAFLITEKALLGKISMSGLLHDLDKPFLYLVFGVKRGHAIHKGFSRHHIDSVMTFDGEMFEKYCTQMIIDWECARLTKKDKQKSAREYLMNFDDNIKDRVSPVLSKLGL